MKVTRLQITAFLALAVGLWIAYLLIQGTPVTRETLAPFSTVVGILVGASVLLEHVLWRQWWLQPWFISRPDLRGTWLVELRSNWTDPNTGKAIAPIRGFMAVTQTLSRLQMHLMTRESQSWLIAERIFPSPKNDGYSLAAVYTNEPHPHLRGLRSEIHYGAFAVDTHGARIRPDSLTGQYWTDRGTKGTMVLTARAESVYSRFEDANSALAAEGDACLTRSWS